MRIAKINQRNSCLSMRKGIKISSPRIVFWIFCMLLGFLYSLAAANIFAEILFLTVFSLKWLVFFFICAGIIISASLILSERKFFETTFSVYDLLSVLILLFVTGAIYSRYSTIIVGGQDPCIYTAYALNLIDYDSLSRPLRALSQMPGEDIRAFTGVMDNLGRSPFNGTMIKAHDGKFFIENDFFPGPAILHAIIGFFKREMLFYGSTIISICSVLVFYFYLRLIMNNRFALSGALILSLNPAQIWFGTATYSEVISQAMLFTSLLSFHTARKLDSNMHLLLGLMCLSGLVLFRVDNVLFPMVYLLYTLTFELKWRRSIFLVMITLSLIFLCSYNHPVYFNRISAESFVLEKQHLILAMLGILICGAYRKKINFSRIISRCSNLINLKLLGAVILVGFVWLIVIRPALPPFHMEMIHGRILRTYGEDGLFRLTYIMALPVVVIGFIYLLLSLFKFVREDNRKILLLNILCYLPFAFVLFWEPHNSPQMYWCLRRFIPVVIPTIIIFFIYFFYELEGQKALVFCLVLIALAWQVYILHTTITHREMAGAVNSVQDFKNKFGDDAVIVTDNTQRHQLFSLYYYGNLDVIPFAKKEILQKNGYKPFSKGLNYVIVSDAIGRWESTCSWSRAQFNFTYSRLGENYDRLPWEIYKLNIPIPVWHVHEEGRFAIEDLGIQDAYPSESVGGIKFIWLNNDSKIVVPNCGRELSLKLSTFGRPQTVLLRINGEQMGTLPLGEKTFRQFRVNVDSFDSGEDLHIRLQGDEFVPEKDMRALTVALSELTFK